MEKKDRIFDFNQSVNIKKQKVQAIVLLVFAFFVMPIFNELISISGSDRPVFNSISRLAWVDKLFPLIIFWGLVNMGVYIYGLYQMLQTGQYVKSFKIFAYVFAGVGALLMTVGISIPAYYVPEDAYYVALRTAHTAVSTTGFVFFYFLLIILAITSFKRNKLQGFIEVMIVVSMIIAGAYAIVEVNDINSYCTTSTVSQILIFCLYNIAMTLFMIFNTVFPIDSKVNKSEDIE